MGKYLTLGGWALSGILVAALFIMGEVNDRRVDGYLDTIAQKDTRISALNAAHERNQGEIARCVAVNAENAMARVAAEQRANEALVRLAALVAWSEDMMNDIEDDAVTIREGDDGTCRTLTDELPADFLDWVFDNAQ